MAKYLALLLLTFNSFVLVAQIDEQYVAKANKIIERLLSDKPLPNKIYSEDNKFKPPAHHHTFAYWVTRDIDGLKWDSVEMQIMINDTSNDLEFDEGYWKGGNIVKGFHYNIQRGEMNWAYASGEEDTTIKPIKQGSDMLYPENRHSVFFDKRKATKEETEQAMKLYIPKLIISIDELYDLLF